MSVKLIGESLEVHCANEFEKIRPYMQHAYFEKDNDISKNGTKGILSSVIIMMPVVDEKSSVA